MAGVGESDEYLLEFERADRLDRAWNVVLYAAIAEVVLTSLGLLLFIFTVADPRLRLALVLAQAGYVLLRSLIAYCVYFRVRWAAWLGGVIAGISVVSGVLVLVLAALGKGSAVDAFQVSGTMFTNTLLTTIHGWAEVIADSVFLVGLAMVRLAHRPR